MATTTTSSSPHFDLNNVLNMQQKYAVDLTNIPINADTNNSNTNAINDLTTKLSSMRDNVQSSQAGSQAVIFKQKIVNDIIDTETKRLNDKKANIDTAITGQKRMVALNNNYQKRYAAYTKMMIAITVGIVIYIFMDKLMAMAPFIPPVVFYLIIIVVLGTIVVYVYLLWADIQMREKTNFDELALPAPDLSGSPSANAGAGGASGGAGGAGTPGSTIDYSNCQGNACCKTGTTWDPTKGCYA